LALFSYIHLHRLFFYTGREACAINHLQTFETGPLCAPSLQ
jgi:hypothetical protein